MVIGLKLVSLETEDKEKIANSLASIIATDIPEGGLPHLIKWYERQPMTKQFSKYIFAALGMVIGVYAALTWVART